jgi:hypothetical protein
MQEGGDRGKAPNKTGTQPKKRTRSPLKRNRTKTVGGVSTARKAGRKKTARGTTRRSDDKR